MNDAELGNRVQGELDAAVRPMVQAHGGDVRVVDVVNGVVDVRFFGACAACELRPVTYAATVRAGLLSIEGVRAVRCESVPLSGPRLDSIAAFFA
jgi:Fe-S cluster biogenesis protein NfuA